MLKLKLQYCGHMMQRTDLLEKTLMLGKIEGGRRRGWQRMRWLDGITDSMDMNLYLSQLTCWFLFIFHLYFIRLLRFWSPVLMWAFSPHHQEIYQWGVLPLNSVLTFSAWRWHQRPYRLRAQSYKTARLLPTKCHYLCFDQLPTKVHLVKALVFPVVMYGCEGWTIKKAEH